MMDSSARRSTGLMPAGWTSPPARFVIIALLIGLITIGGLDLSQRAGRIATIWPANGALLGILLTNRPTRWPAFLLMGFAANLGMTWIWGYPFDVCLRFSLVNAFEVTIASTVLWRLVGPNCDLSRPESLWRFAFAAGLLAPTLAVILNVGLAHLFADNRSVANFVASFLAHALGLVTATPVALAVRRKELLPLLGPQRAKGTVVAFAILLATTSVVFAQSRYPLLFLILPPLVLVVFRCGLAGGALGLLLATLVSIGFTVVGTGPTSIIVNVTTLERIMVVQTFAATSGILVLTLAAILAQRDGVQRDLLAAKEELTRLASTDALTGLHNRRRLDEALAEETRRAERSRAPLSLLLIDVDRFKAFNDHYGHLGGDECLQHIAATIRSFGRRPGDLVARYGGEELAVLLPETDARGALMVGEEIRKAIEALDLPHVGNETCGGRVTVSIGVATAASTQLSYKPEVLIGGADQLLYEAKRTGRNKVLSPINRLTDPVPPVLAEEERRVAEVEPYLSLMAGRRCAELDAVAKRAAEFLNSPIGLVTLVGRDQQTFIGRHGLDATGTARDVSFCAHVITGTEPMVVADATADPRFKNNALVTGEPDIRFYAGAPLVSSDKANPLGALCVIDRVTHPPLTAYQRDELTSLASVAVRSIEALDISRPVAA